jgi:protocatechuate 3,4-dioxygenase beta subunit
LKTRLFTRRKLLSIASAVPIVGTLPALASARRQDRLTVTPRQTEGPFYPRRKPADIDNDLTVISPNTDIADGPLLLLRGRVLDASGNALGGARVELWHCDQLGTYHHVGAQAPHDEEFQGYGELQTDTDGHYSFRTVRPGRYPGRTPHIHFKVIASGRRPLTSQMYFDDEMESNMRDGIYRRLSPAERTAVTIATQATPHQTTEQIGALDIVLA